MNDKLLVILTFGIFVIPPFVFSRLILIPSISRKLFSLLSSLLVGIQFFLLVQIFVQFQPLLIGSLLFIGSLPGTFLVVYFLYPGLKSWIESFRK